MSSPPAPPLPAFAFLLEGSAPAPTPPPVPSPSPETTPPTSDDVPSRVLSPNSPPPPPPPTSAPAPSASYSFPSPLPLLPNSTGPGPEKNPAPLPVPTFPVSAGGSPGSGSGSKSVSVGVSVGVVVAVLLLLAIGGVYWFKKRRRRTSPPPDKGGDPSLPHDKESVGGSATPPRPPPANTDHHVVKISPDPYAALPSPLRREGPAASRYPSGPEDVMPQPGVALGTSRSSSFTYEELERATDGFSDYNFLGHGGFGYVHRGVLRNGLEVAVKQLSAGSFQGDREFQAEVEVISRVHHKHLVSLVGYCVAGGKRLLVYEFVPNGTLEFHLHVKEEGPAMDWATRLKIALGSGKGLAYLHEDCRPKIIHRDIKAANILLDDKFEPMGHVGLPNRIPNVISSNRHIIMKDSKVADFGLAKFAYDSKTHVSTRVMGTFGYLAPEYASTGKLTEKSDVFSYGVMLLELITGRRPTDSIQSSKDDSLLDWVRPLLIRALGDGNYDPFVDPKMNKDYNRKEMARMIACTAACVRHSARRRPRMSLVVRVLEGDASLDDLNEGIKPGHSEIYSLQDGSDLESLKYGEVMKNFKKNGLGSGENASSAATSTNEYVMNLSTASSESRQAQEMEKTKVD